MKVLRVVPFPPQFIGGLAFYYKNISQNLSKFKNVKCDILTPDLFNMNKKISYLDRNIRIIYKKCYFYLANKNPFANIFSFLKKHYMEYDIIHAHGYYFFTTLQCALFKKIQDFPFILHLTGGIETPYNFVSNIYENFQLIFKEKLFDKLIGYKPIKYADAVISVSYKDLEIINKKIPKKGQIRIHIPNGVDTDRFRRITHIKRKYITLIATRLSYIKGLDIFLNIAKELYKSNRNLRFLIVGYGPLENLITEAQKSIPIKLLYTYPYEKMQELYNKSIIVMITSRTEGFPNIIYESFACETPVVASKVGDIPRIVKHNENGLLFNINNYDNIAKIILDLIGDEEKLHKLGKKGRELIEKNHSWELITDRVYNFYENFLSLKKYG